MAWYVHVFEFPFAHLRARNTFDPVPSIDLKVLVLSLSGRPI